jgi:murein L,D-transpeptidase YafK
VVVALAGVAFVWRLSVRPDRGDEARLRAGPELGRALGAVGGQLGSAAFIRVFKESRTLELWVRPGERFVLLKTYPICRVSGELGPKTASGDLQAPEGLYALTRSQLHPRSRYYLALNLGYPNAFEAARGFTGDALMIHGDCVSIGCYAMGDGAIAEIFTVVREALRAGQQAVLVQALPFPLTRENLARHETSRHREYWRTLEPAYRFFERDRIPPRVTVSAAGYRIEPATPSI